MSPAAIALSSAGITHNMLILGILFVAAAAIIGMYWQIILPGAIALTVASVFITSEPQVTVEAKAQVNSPFTSQVAVPDVPKVQEFDERQAYIKDCIEVAEYSMFQCQKLWNERVAEEGKLEANQDVIFKPASKAQLLNVSNREYKQRRAEAMMKPNAVVSQMTYH
jgi:hypothetical protein